MSRYNISKYKYMVLKGGGCINNAEKCNAPYPFWDEKKKQCCKANDCGVCLDLYERFLIGYALTQDIEELKTVLDKLLVNNQSTILSLGSRDGKHEKYLQDLFNVGEKKIQIHCTDIMPFNTNEIKVEEYNFVDAVDKYKDNDLLLSIYPYFLDSTLYEAIEKFNGTFLVFLTYIYDTIEIDKNIQHPWVGIRKEWKVLKNNKIISVYINDSIIKQIKSCIKSYNDDILGFYIYSVYVLENEMGITFYIGTNNVTLDDTTEDGHYVPFVMTYNEIIYGIKYDEDGNQLRVYNEYVENPKNEDIKSDIHNMVMTQFMEKIKIILEKDNENGKKNIDRIKEEIKYISTKEKILWDEIPFAKSLINYVMSKINCDEDCRELNIYKNFFQHILDIYDR